MFAHPSQVLPEQTGQGCHGSEMKVKSIVWNIESQPRVLAPAPLTDRQRQAFTAGFTASVPPTAYIIRHLICLLAKFFLFHLVRLTSDPINIRLRLSGSLPFLLWSSRIHLGS